MTELLEEPQALEPVDDWSDVDPDYEPILPDDDEQDDIVEDPSELDEDLTEEEIEIPDDLAELLPFWVSYELHGRNLDAETTWALLATEDFDGDLEVEVDGLTAGARWEFRVRLIDRDGRHSRFSEPLVIDLPTDFTPPPAPTEPIVRNVRGYTAVGWDGLLQGPTPGDMSHVQLYVQQQHPDGDPDGEPGDPRRITTMATAGEHPLLQFLANVLHKAWFTAVDTTGNESPWSPQVEFTPTPPVNEDAINQRLDEARQEREAYVEDFNERTDQYDAQIGELDTRVGPALESSISEAVTEAQSNLQGLDQRQEAVEQSVSEATERLGTAETLLSGRERVHTGEGEPDEATAARGITYEWAGEPHASESIKRVDGVEVARNLATNPELENDTYAWTTFGATIRTTTAHDQMWRRGPGPILQATANSSSTFSVRHDQVPLMGRYLSVHVLIATDAQLEVSDQTWFYDANGNVIAVNYGAYRSAPWYDGAELQYAVEVPDGAVTAEVRLYGRPTEAGDRLWVDRTMIITTADTEADALAQVETYFDGDTEDVLDAPATEGTIYYQTEGDEIVAIWRRSTDEWVKLPLRDEVLASVSVGKLVADGASITDAVVEQLLANKASIIAGEMQKLTVTERADFVSAWADELYADEFTARSSTVVNQTVTGQLIIDGITQATEALIQRLFTDETVSRIVWAEIVRAGLLEADEGLIGGVLLKDGAVTLDKLHAIEEIAAALVRTVELESGTFKTNDMTSMRILSSIIESTIYLIHNAAGDVSVRLDGMDNFIAGELNTFATPAERDAQLGPNVTLGTSASTIIPPIDWRREQDGWVPVPGAWKLDEIDFSNQPTDDPQRLHIHPDLQGMFSRYELIVRAGVVEGSLTRALMVTVNDEYGPGYERYRFAARAERADGTIETSLSGDGEGYPRMGYVGRYEGHLQINLSTPTYGDTGYFTWETNGWANAGAGGGGWLIRSGGRWNIPNQVRVPITHFGVRPATGAGRTWAESASAELWGYR